MPAVDESLPGFVRHIRLETRLQLPGGGKPLFVRPDAGVHPCEPDCALSRAFRDLRAVYRADENIGEALLLYGSTGNEDRTL